MGEWWAFGSGEVSEGVQDDGMSLDQGIKGGQRIEKSLRRGWVYLLGSFFIG